jgi:hypothetical protein
VPSSGREPVSGSMPARKATRTTSNSSKVGAAI